MKIQDVYKEVEKMTDKFFGVSYEMNRHNIGEIEIICDIYIKEFGYFRAPTFGLALENAKKAMGKIKPDILNIDG